MRGAPDHGRDPCSRSSDLGALKPATPEAPKYVQKLDKQGRAYATGKRKNAVARVWIKPGSGKITVNDARPSRCIFARPVLRMLIQQPIVVANRAGQYDVICTVSGGGLSGQAGAVRHGLSKALTYFEPDLRGALKRGGFLTRDSRVVERKKYGKAKARRSLPVLQALSANYGSYTKGRAAARPFSFAAACLAPVRPINIPAAFSVHEEAGWTARSALA